MKRRQFITLLGGAAAWPLGAWAQQPAMPVIGFIFSGTSEGGAANLAAFRKGLTGAGYVEGLNVAIEYRWADYQNDRLPALANDLVRRKVALIIASPGPAALATKVATTTIPVVFQVGGDPVKLGLVSSFNQPGGNLTGVSQLSTELSAKRLELLHDLVPNASLIAVLADPLGPTSEEQVGNLQGAARALGLRLLIVNAREIDFVSAKLSQQQIDAIFVTASAYFFSERDQIISLAARHSIPAIYESRDFTGAGGLISYGVDFMDVYQQVGVYAGRILGGEKPADLPVQQATKLELIINLKTAKSLSLTIPPGVLALADEVIE